MQNLKIYFIKASLVVVAFAVYAWVTGPTEVHAATAPTFGETGAYSVLGGTTVTNTGATTTNARVGVSPGTAITGFPPGIAGGSTHSNDASAIAAQADNLSIFGALDQTCDTSYASGQDLTLVSPLVAGVYCSAGSFLLTGDLTLSGSGVWIFKSVSTVITSPDSSITGGTACNVFWRVGSSATLDTSTSFIGNIFALTSITMNTGATLNGRALAQNGQVSLQSNTISSPCTTSSSISTLTSGGPPLSSLSSKVCPALNSVTPIIIESRRVDADSIFISWGPYSGINTFIVQYGLENGKWLYSTNVTGFSTTINALPANQPIWVRVAATDGCSVGIYSMSMLVGGPLLPNTGLTPRQNNIPWNAAIPVGIVMLVSASLLKNIYNRKSCQGKQY